MKHTNYIPLHGHSAYSLGDGITKIEDIIKRAKELNSDAVGLTEHGNMSSFMKFYKLAKKENIKPILGCEFYLNDLYYNDRDKFLNAKRKKKNDLVEDDDSGVLDDYDDLNSHFLAYACNFEGLQNIIKLSNKGFFNFYRKPLISTPMIFDHLNKNNIVTTGCLNSQFNKLILTNRIDEVAKLLKKYKDTFEDNFYLEIQFSDLKEQAFVNEFYKKISKKTGIKPVFSLDYHYAWPDDWYIQYLLYVIKGKKTISTYTPEDWFYGVRDLYIKDIQTIYDYAKKTNFDVEFLEEAIDSTFEIRDKVNVEIKMYEDNSPKFTNNFEDSKKIFLEKVKDGFKEKLKENLIPKDKLKIYEDRLKYEVKIMLDKNIIDYFLILDDVLNGFVTKNGGILGAGRGCFTPDMLVSLFDNSKIPIEDIKIGDKIKNYFNNETIVDNIFKYEINEEIIELEFDNNTKIKCTKDHKILTNNGWKEAQNINEIDEIISI